jgi:hypothetical protein
MLQFAAARDWRISSVAAMRCARLELARLFNGVKTVPPLPVDKI